MNSIGCILHFIRSCEHFFAFYFRRFKIPSMIFCCAALYQWQNPYTSVEWSEETSTDVANRAMNKTMATPLNHGEPTKHLKNVVVDEKCKMRKKCYAHRAAETTRNDGIWIIQKFTTSKIGDLYCFNGVCFSPFPSIYSCRWFEFVYSVFVKWCGCCCWNVLCYVWHRTTKLFVRRRMHRKWIEWDQNVFLGMSQNT